MQEELCLPILLACCRPFLKMYLAVWLISDVAFTPFALKQQHGIPLPLFATCVRLMMMSRNKTCSLPLHGGFPSQEVRGLISQAGFQDVSAFLHQENNKLHLFLYELI
jgi:hypothetical protein